jgi:hypothetical protein
LGAEETLIFNDFQNQALMVAPGQGNIPIPLFKDLNAEELSFPTIYAGIPRQFKEGLKVSYTDIAKSEIRRHDRRACKPTHLLYAFKRSYNEKVRQSVQVYMRKTTGNEKIFARNAREPRFIEDLVKKDHGYTVFKDLRSSPPYWQAKSKIVRSMVRQQGKCTVFITLSAAETKWTELLVMLSKILKNKVITEEEAAALTFNEKAELIRSDPVTCMRHFDHRYRSLLNKLFKPEEGKVLIFYLI